LAQAGIGNYAHLAIDVNNTLRLREKPLRATLLQCDDPRSLYSYYLYLLMLVATMKACSSRWRPVSWLLQSVRWVNADITTEPHPMTTSYTINAMTGCCLCDVVRGKFRRLWWPGGKCMPMPMPTCAVAGCALSPFRCKATSEHGVTLHQLTNKLLEMMTPNETRLACSEDLRQAT
jgi:hypothetical protein